MKIDIGCGSRKHPECFGIDRRPLPGVDLVCDLNNGLPLPDDSVEFAMASRSLPYLADLTAMMTELFRVCIHKAVVCIVSPYAHSFAHMSNPLLKHKFDEHTPRYFTRQFYQPEAGAVCPPLAEYEDDSPLPFDFRLLRMEFFYKPPYTSPLYEQEELEQLMQLQANVAHEIMYHFAVIKKPVATAELDQLSRLSFPEPLDIARQRRE